jgi:hypothetical protein
MKRNRYIHKRKTKAEIDSNIKFLPNPEWQEIHVYHRTNKRALYVDENKKR